MFCYQTNFFKMQNESSSASYACRNKMEDGLLACTVFSQATPKLYFITEVNFAISKGLPDIAVEKSC